VKITVITAALNARDALQRSRASVLAQRQVQVQHVIVDGGSTDGTRELLSEWQSDDQCVCVSEVDSGVYAAFNKGLKLAVGDCIGFLNAGDIYQDDYVLSDVVGALRDPNVDLVYGNVDITTRDRIEQTVRRYRSDGFSREKLLFGFMPPHPSLYARANLYREVGPFSEAFRIAGDFEWAIRAFLKCRVNSRYLERTFVRMPAGGLSNNGLSSAFRNTIEMRAALRKHQIPASWYRLIMRLPLKWLRA
jgi:glycosyltransferase involved in cell wall biosynthesis